MQLFSDLSHRGCLILLLLWASFVVRCGTYAVSLPLWEGPDEPAHFAYIQTLAEFHTFPTPDTRVSREVAASLALAPLPASGKGFGLGLTHEAFLALPQAEKESRADKLNSIPPSWRREPAQVDGNSYLKVYQAQHGPLYYFLCLPVYVCLGEASLWARVLALRLFSVGLASLVLFPTFFLGRRILGSERGGLLCTALVAFFPGMPLDAARLGNDALAIPLFGLLMAAFCGESPLVLRRPLLTGLLLGCGLLTKAFFLPAVPVALVAAFFMGSGPRSLRFRRTGLLLFGAVALSFPWFARNWMLLGSFSGAQEAVALRGAPLSRYIWAATSVDWLRAMDVFFSTHLWVGGWSFLFLRKWMYSLAHFTLLIALAGLGKSLWRKWKSDQSLPKDFFVLSGFCLFFLAGLMWHMVLCQAAWGEVALNGWYYCSSLAGTIPLLILGLREWCPKRLAMRLAGLPLIALAVLDFYGEFFVALPYYSGALIRNASGRLSSFHPEALSSSDVSRMLHALFWGRPDWMCSGLQIATLVCQGGVIVMAILAGLYLLAFPHGSAAGQDESPC